MSVRSSIARDPNPPFVPSPRWLSESPARRTPSSQGTPAHISYPGEPIPPSHGLQAPSFHAALRSPVPPPPANLYQTPASAFNVDPGQAFLATAGPSDAGSDGGSVRGEIPRERNPLGGLVTGLKKVSKSVRRSLRDSTRSRSAETDIYRQPAELRDSGYGVSSPQVNIPPEAGPYYIPQRPPYSSHHSFNSQRAHSDTFSRHNEGRRFGRDATQVIEHQRIPSPEIMIGSPVSADPEYGSDYAQMNLTTPPPSEISFNTYLNNYLKRTQEFVHTVNKLPWVAKERVTTDYYPDRTRRKDEIKHHPAISWHSKHYDRNDYLVSVGHTPRSDASSQGGPPPSVNPNIFVTPRRRSHADMNLDDEFEAHTPYPQNTTQLTPFPQNASELPQNPPQSTSLPLNPLQYTSLPLYPPPFRLPPRDAPQRNGTSLAHAGGVMLTDPGPVSLNPPNAEAPAPTPRHYVPPPPTRNVQPPTPRHYAPPPPSRTPNIQPSTPHHFDSPPPIIGFPDAEPEQSPPLGPEREPTPTPASAARDWGVWAGAVSQAQHPPMGMPPPPGQISTFGTEHRSYARPGPAMPAPENAQYRDRDRGLSSQQPIAYVPSGSRSAASSRSRSPRSAHRIASRVQTPAPSRSGAILIPITPSESNSDLEWEEYPEERNGYVPYEDEAAQNYYHAGRPPSSRSAASSRRR